MRAFYTRQKNTIVFFAALCVAGLSLAFLIVEKEKTGEVLWTQFRAANLALFLNRDAGFAMEIGNYYFGVGDSKEYDLAQAERYFRKALALDPLVPDAWHQLARIDFLRGNFQDALYKINRQIDLHGESFMASYYLRGLIHGYRAVEQPARLQESDFKNAEENFLKFLEWKPRSWAAHNDLAWVYFQWGKFHEAHEIARKGLALHPGNVWLLNMRGAALLNLGEKESAKAFFADALQGAEKLTEAHWHKAYPGNDPRLARQGLKEMIDAIKTNLTRASLD